MTDEQLTELIRARDTEHRLAPPEALWERVERGLGPPPAAQPRARVRMLRAPLRVAAGLAALLLVAWLLWPTGANEAGAEVTAAAELEDVELEATPAAQPVLERATYDGVQIREGVLGRDELRSCVAC